MLIVGLPFRKGINELEKAGLTSLTSRVVKPPRIAECGRHSECKVEWTKNWIDRLMVVGKVVAVSINEDCLSHDGKIIWEKLKPAHYCGMRYKNKFAPAYQSMAVDWNYEGSDKEFRHGSDWRDQFRS